MSIQDGWTVKPTARDMVEDGLFNVDFSDLHKATEYAYFLEYVHQVLIKNYFVSVIKPTNCSTGTHASIHRCA